MNCGVICWWCLPAINPSVPFLRASCHPSGSSKKGSGKGHDVWKSPSKARPSDTREGDAVGPRRAQPRGGGPWGAMRGARHHDGARHRGSCPAGLRPNPRPAAPAPLPQPLGPQHGPSTPPCQPYLMVYETPWTLMLLGSCPTAIPLPACPMLPLFSRLGDVLPDILGSGAPQPPCVPHAAGPVPATATVTAAATTMPPPAPRRGSSHCPGSAGRCPRHLPRQRKQRGCLFFLFPEKNWSVISWSRYLMYL